MTSPVPAVLSAAEDWYQQAVSHHAARRFEAAVSCLHHALRARKGYLEARKLLALAWYDLGDLDMAYLHLLEARRLQAKDAEVLLHLGLIHLRRYQLTQAAEYTHQALARDERLPAAWTNLGILHQLAGRWSAALHCQNRALELNPQFSSARLNRALLHREMGRLEAARLDIEAALQGGPTGYKVLYNKGLIHLDLGEAEAASQSLEQARMLAPQAPEVLAALAQACRLQGRLADMEAHLLAALHAHPDHAEARAALGQLRISQGNFGEGWDLYEARLRSRESPQHPFAMPQWESSDRPVARRILVYAEQGIGDIVMFASCLPDLARDAAAVLFACEPRLEPMMRHSFPQLQVRAWTPGQEGTWPDLDTWEHVLPVGSLPRFYRRTAAAFLEAGQAYLSVPPDVSSAVAAAMQTAGVGRPRIGIAWRAGLLKTGREMRSLPLAGINALVQSVPASWVSLQHDLDPGEALPRDTQGADIHHPEQLRDPVRLAAVIAQLDMVVAPPGSVVHFAGATGVPCWVMTPAHPAWRYMLRGDSMPWYASVVLVRQRQAGVWDEVLTAIGEELRKRLARPSKGGVHAC